MDSAVLSENTSCGRNHAWEPGRNIACYIGANAVQKIVQGIITVENIKTYAAAAPVVAICYWESAAICDASRMAYFANVLAEPAVEVIANTLVYDKGDFIDRSGASRHADLRLTYFLLAFGLLANFLLARRHFVRLK